MLFPRQDLSDVKHLLAILNFEQILAGNAIFKTENTGLKILVMNVET